MRQRHILFENVFLVPVDIQLCENDPVNDLWVAVVKVLLLWTDHVHDFNNLFHFVAPVVLVEMLKNS